MRARIVDAHDARDDSDIDDEGNHEDDNADDTEPAFRCHGIGNVGLTRLVVAIAVLIDFSRSKCIISCRLFHQVHSNPSSCYSNCTDNKAYGTGIVQVRCGESPNGCANGLLQLEVHPGSLTAPSGTYQ
jgi:hypothetical protein